MASSEKHKLHVKRFLPALRSRFAALAHDLTMIPAAPVFDLQTAAPVPAEPTSTAEEELRPFSFDDIKAVGTAVECDPSLAPAHYNLGNALRAS